MLHSRDVKHSVLRNVWIANAMYLGFVVQALVGTVIKLLAYRRGC